MKTSTKSKKQDTKKQSSIKNQVLHDNYQPSGNFYKSDMVLQAFLKKELSTEGLTYMQNSLNATGLAAAGKMNELSLLADKNFPELVKRNTWGETINEIKFHPSYWELMEIAINTQMFRVKWEPSLRNKFAGERNRLGFANGFIYAMSEMGQYCPLCMTDGAAKLIDKYAVDEDKERLLKHIFTNEVKEFYTGAMFLTEKSGGSDVGANLTTAKWIEDDLYYLNGEKWFCSNANADIIFALARTDESIQGTKGLSIFMIEKHLPDGSKNPIEIIRIKDKLGVRSMATAECMLTNTVGKLVGEEFTGFNIMTEMINLSRVYTAMGSLSGSRRALIEAYQFLNHRSAFGKIVIEHALVREKLHELGSLYIANFYLVWRIIRALDLTENGDSSEGQLLRLLTPMVKKHVSESGIYIARESMELMGGMGYIEDTVMPKIVRDLMVNPIWEGSGNIMVLDMIRALEKSNGFEILCREISNTAITGGSEFKWLVKELDQVRAFSKQFGTLNRDEMESSAKPMFEKLTGIYQVAILVNSLDNENRDWILPTLSYLKKSFGHKNLETRTPISTEQAKRLIAWEF